MWPETIAKLAAETIRAYAGAGRMIATAESCTGGLLAGSLTAIAGSSASVERGWVTYSNQAKIDLLGVDPTVLDEHGAVSAAVAEAMAAGALGRSEADVAISITGIAGPGGATETKPVGLVFIGMMQRGGAASHQRHHFAGDRDAVRLASVEAALKLLLSVRPY